MEILVIGSGFAALSTTFSALAQGLDVTLLSPLRPKDITDGRIRSTQCHFRMARSIVADAGIPVWQDVAPVIDHVQITALADGQPMLDWTQPLGPSGPAATPDLRLIVPHSLQLLGMQGRVRYHRGPLSVREVDALADPFDLVLVADPALADLFPTDPARTPTSQPRRRLSVTYAHGADLDDDRVLVWLVPGIGEILILPGYTLTGPCHMVLVEALPGGPWDRWTPEMTPDEHWHALQDVLRSHLPAIGESFATAELTDPLGVLAGAVTPWVRSPVGALPSGRPAMAVGDLFATVDPLCAQGGNTAAKVGHYVADAIAARGNEPPTREWLHDVAEGAWQEIVRWAVQFSDVMTAVPMPDEIASSLEATGSSEDARRGFVAGFDSPRVLFSEGPQELAS
jgi:hypothetical protein